MSSCFIKCYINCSLPLCVDSDCAPPIKKSFLRLWNVEEDAAKAKYTFSEIYDYVVHKTYPSHADKLYKHGLRKRSKFFIADGGRLYYIGGKGSQKPRLVVESAEERRRIIGNIHDQAHLGRDKTLSEITA